MSRITRKTDGDIRLTKSKLTAFKYSYNVIEYDYFGNVREVLYTLDSRDSEEDVMKHILRDTGFQF